MIIKYLWLILCILICLTTEIPIFNGLGWFGFGVFLFDVVDSLSKIGKNPTL